MPDDEMLRKSDLFSSSETDLRDESILIHKNLYDVEASDSTLLIYQEKRYKSTAKLSLESRCIVLALRNHHEPLYQLTLG